MIDVRMADAGHVRGILQVLHAQNPYAAACIDSDDVAAYRGVEEARWLQWEREGHVPARRVALVACVQGQIAAYVGGVCGLPEAICGATQTVIQDLAWVDGSTVAALLDGVRQCARERGDAYLVADVEAGDQARADLLDECGFKPEIIRIRKRLEAAEPQQLGRYQVRRAGDGDRAYMLWLAQETCLHMVAGVRPVSEKSIRRAYRERYLELDLTAEVDPIGWMVSENGEPCGFLVYQCDYRDPVTQRLTAFILDIAIQPGHWGTGAAVALMTGGEKSLCTLGIATVFASIAVDNPRPLSRATRTLGYQIAAHTWVAPC